VPSPPDSPGSPPPRRLLDQVADALRVRHYSPKTVDAYVHWVRRFILFNERRHPAELGKDEVARFLSHLAIGAKVSASTQNQALSALLFLYAEVLGSELGWMEDVVRAKRPARLPVVMSRLEVNAVLAGLSGSTRLMASLLYGSGLRLVECVTLRVKDVDFGAGQLTVRRGKGQRDRAALLPQSLVEPLTRHLAAVRRQHEVDVARGAGFVELPNALSTKYPNAPREWPWQWVFPATRTYIPRQASGGATTCTRRSCNAPSARRRGPRGYRSR
jgi:integron integrase